MSRTAPILVLLAATLLLAVGCGSEAQRVEVPPKDPKDSGVAKARANEPVRNLSREVDGWTPASWEDVGGAPRAFPELELPERTTYVSVVEYAGSNADVADVSGTTADSREMTMERIAAQFEGWDEVEDRPRTDGAWERGERSAEVKLRSQDGGTFYFITVANRFD